MRQLPAPKYSDTNFWRKLKRFAASAGREVVEKALQLYYALQSPATPKWAKTVIIGALAYFILPADAIPDILPGVGYADDLGAIAAALSTVHAFITPDMRATAKSKVEQLFPSAPVKDE